MAVAATAGSLWVASMDDNSVTRIDARTGHVLRSIPLGGVPTALTTTADAVWVSDETGRITRTDPEYNRALTVQQLAAGSTASRGVSWPILAGFGSVWVANPDGYVVRLDDETGRQTASVEVGNDPTAIAIGSGSVWVTNGADGTVTRIDPTTLLARTIPVGHGPAAVGVNSTGVWVANAGDNTVVADRPSDRRRHRHDARRGRGGCGPRDRSRRVGRRRPRRHRGDTGPPLRRRDAVAVCRRHSHGGRVRRGKGVGHRGHRAPAAAPLEVSRTSRCRTTCRRWTRHWA